MVQEKNSEKFAVFDQLVQQVCLTALQCRETAAEQGKF